MTMMNEQYLAHFGIKGQKWGVRRFQNEDMSLTPAGRERYGLSKAERKAERKAAGSGRLYKANNTAAAQKYKDAKLKLTRDALDSGSLSVKKANVVEKNKAFKESKEAFKSNKTVGQKIANVLINGPIGAGIYNNMRASGYSVAVSEGTVIASTLLVGPMGQLAFYLGTRKGG